MAYAAFANEMTKKEWFGEILPIQEILREISGILNK